MKFENSKGKKILLVTPYNRKKSEFSKGGIAIWSILYMEEVKKTNYEVHVVDTTAIGKRMKKNNAKKNLFLEVIRAFKIIVTFMWKITFKKPDIIHINSACGTAGLFRDYICLLFTNRRKHNVILHLHCDVERALAKHKNSKLIEKCLKRVNVVLVLNNKSYEYCKKFNYKSEVVIVPNFINRLMVKNTVVQSRDCIENVVFVGFIQREKGILEIIEISKMFPTISFTLVGDKSPEFNDFIFPKNVSVLEHATRDEVFKQLDKSDLFLFPSHSEGFSMALLEAMSRGLPIVCTNVGANEEMVLNGGIVVDIGDISKMIISIKRIGNPAIRQKMAKDNIERVLNNYTSDKIFSIFELVYNPRNIS